MGEIGLDIAGRLELDERLHLGAVATFERVNVTRSDFRVVAASIVALMTTGIAINFRRKHREHISELS